MKLLPFVIAFVTQAPPDEILIAPSSEMEDSLELFAADRRALSRFYDAPTSNASRERFERFYADWLARLREVDFESLSRAAQIDWILLRSRIEHEQKRLELDAARDAEMAELVPFAARIVDLHETRRRLEDVDPAAAAKAVAALVDAVTDARAAVEGASKEEKKPRASVANRAASAVGELRGTLREWYDYQAEYDPLFTWWLKEPYDEARRELEKYQKVLREDLAGVKADDEDAIIGDPIGREALEVELAHEWIPYSPEELVAIAEREFAWCEERMAEASRELGFGGDWHAALEHVKDLYVEPGRQPALIRDLAREAIRFLDERDLVTIPAVCREVWRMEMMSPQRQKITPFFTGGEVIHVSYPTSGMSQEEKLMSMRGNNVHFSRATVHHELVPGHHLQGFMAQRYATQRRMFRTAFYSEGWALYWELLLWDLGFARSPEDEVGMLFWRAHRCARIITSLGYHLGTMTTDEMIDFLVERVGHELEGAKGEVRRWVGGSYGPLYQCAYMIGGLQIRALRAELVETGRMTDKEFHDAVLLQNAIPIELVRAALTGVELTPDMRSSWRFEG